MNNVAKLIHDMISAADRLDVAGSEAEGARIRKLYRFNFAYHRMRMERDAWAPADIVRLLHAIDTGDLFPPEGI